MATATSKLNIIIDVLGDKAQSSLSGIQKGLSQIAIVTGTVVAAGIAAKKAWDFAREGAELDKVASQFGNVATNAGYMADVLLGKMRQATGGMVTDAELMASGLSIIELGLADSEQGVVDLATVVSTLGLDMQQVIMTFANDSVMRLDALGLSVETVTKRAAELKREGFTGDAFDQAVLEGLQDRMKVLGDASETTAGQILILENRFKNAKDEAAMLATEISGPLISGFNQYLDYNELLSNAYEQQLITGGDVAVMKGDLSRGLITEIQLVERLIALLEVEQARQERVNQGAVDADQIFDNYNRTIQTNATALYKSATASEHYATSLGYIASQSQVAAQNSSDFMDGLDRQIASPIANFIADLEWFMAGGGEIISAWDNIKTAWENDAISDEDALNMAKGLFTLSQDFEEEIGNIDITDAAQNIADTLKIPLEDAIALIEDTGGVDEVLAGIADIVFENQSIIDVNEQLTELGDLIGGLPRVIDIQVNFTQGGWSPSFGIPGSGNSGGNTGGSTGDDIGLHPGGGGFSVTPGGNGDIFIDSLIIIPPTDASMKNLIREAASSAAGSGYTG